MDKALNKLKQDITGEVVLEGDAEYDRLRKTFVHTGTPAVIVRVASSADVAAAIRFARAHDLEIAIRSGGHSGAGWSTNDGGLMIDTSLLNTVEILDEDTGLVRLGPGAKWSEVGATLLEHKLAISSGDTTSVAAGGLLTGGGIGWMVRKYGLAIDWVRRAEIVTAEGEILTLSEEENSDLFWAVRGAGGNFGVVTSFELEANREDGVFFGSIAYPVDQAAQVVRGWGEYMATAPEELTSTIAKFPPVFGDIPLTVLVCYAGNDRAAADAAIEPLRHLGDVQAYDVNLVPYPSILEDASDLPPDWLPRAKNRFVDGFSTEFAETLTSNWGGLDTLYVELRSLGGALGRVSADATAFAHRGATVMVNVANLASAEENVAAAPAFDAFWSTLDPFVTGAYCNLLSEIHEDDVTKSYPTDTYARLAILKAKYDPDNVFHRNVNIKPSLED